MLDNSRRPPSLLDTGEYDTAVRRDLNSDDVRCVYPDLPATQRDRRVFFVTLDERAYDRIRHSYPKLVPPYRQNVRTVGPT